MIARPELKTDPRFAERNERIANRGALREIIESALQAKSAAQWERSFDDAGVPAGPILSVPEIMQHPHVERRQLVKRFTNVLGIGREVAVTRLGFRLDSEQPDVERAPPVLGQDTEAVLRNAGYTDAEIVALRSAGVI